jgi:hypothetical protein
LDGNALAAARLANDGEHFTTLDSKVDAANRFNSATIGFKLDMEVFYR